MRRPGRDADCMTLLAGQVCLCVGGRQRVVCGEEFEMPFTFTTVRRGRDVQETRPNFDVRELIIARDRLRVGWGNIREHLGAEYTVRRVAEVRRSPEFEQAVREYARDFNRYPDPLVRSLCLSTPHPQRSSGGSRSRGSRNDASNLNSAASVVTPSNFPNRRFGIELEVVSKLDRLGIRNALTAAGIQSYRGYYDAPISGGWRLGTDQSVITTRPQRTNGYTETMEIISPPLGGLDGLREVDRVLQAIHPHVSANRTCGQHVHVDLAGVSVDELRRLSAAWLKHEWIVNSLIPLSRRYRTNSYCYDNARQLSRYQGEAFGQHQQLELQRVSRLRTVRRVREEMEDGVEKYRKFNLTSMIRHGTVEFRHWSGTGDPEKVLRNIQFSVGFVSEFLDSDMVVADAERPTLWASTAELLTRLSRWVGDTQFPYYWANRQLALGASA